MKIIIDRFEEDYAVCELSNGKMINIPSEVLREFNQGDVIDIKKNEEETEKRNNEVSSLLDKLFK